MHSLLAANPLRAPTWGDENRLKKPGLIDKMTIENLKKTPFTQLANFTGQPAVSLPLQRTPDGLARDDQFIAPFGDEAALFRLSAQIEKGKPWFDKGPLAA